MKYLRKEKLSLASIFFTFFVDNLSWSIVFPVFAPFFIDPSNELFSSDVSIAARTTILGVFLMSFPLAQFFGAPIIGEYADRFGRKKSLVYTIFFTVIFFGLTAYSMQKEMLWLLFISRFFTGIFSGNLSICLASVADLSSNEKIRIKNFGYLAVIAGLSFIVGAFIGGKLSDPDYGAFFNPALPFWVAMGLAFINLLFVAFAFTETGKVDPSVKFDFLHGIHNIQKALRTKKIKSIYAIYFLFMFSWNILLQFTPVLLVDSFDFDNSEIGDVAAYMGVCWALGSSYVTRFMLKRFAPIKVLEFSLLLFTVFCSTILFLKEINWVLIVIGICVILTGVAWPLCTNLISSRADKDMQGKVLGISQSMQSLAMAISPLVGALTYFYMGFPFLIAVLTSFMAGLFYFFARI